ncbi:jupiter microtubule associated homolog 1-like [Synchiropus splendidus]|uniref:jupiter microtubule associated homolog 1-like n=1 Tax=Synchiropus splendidus TaxID=270530 RepID=UPI00237D914E|nr:jupiter microtubule associated homolog 1-like [Synchiropus splendidus]XP_053711821.1 jupiter microtubule associated homolog 1-like [Synchiropus splendidus]
MTTTKTYTGMEPGAKNSSRVLQPPGGGSNISFGADEEKPPVRKNKMASSVFAEPEDPYANRRNNPPGGKPTGVLCGESSAPLRRGGNQTVDSVTDDSCSNKDQSGSETENNAAEPEHQNDTPQAEEPGAGPPSGRRNPPGGKSSLILG